jgi:uncharacterized protein (TIGR02453 family)
MLHKNTLDFLSMLKENNDRDWMHKNDKIFRSAQQDFEKFVSELIKEIRRFDPSIGMIAPKDCIFRIYRDVRFAKDKSPYKTNMGAYIALGGRKSMRAGYYFHIEPGGSMLAGGLYMPPPEILFRARQEVYYNLDEFDSIINNKLFVTYFGKLSGEKTKLVPKGFEKDFKGIELLKHKSYLVMHSLSDEIICSEKLLGHCGDVFKSQKPFNDFFNKVMEG